MTPDQELIAAISDNLKTTVLNVGEVINATSRLGDLSGLQEERINRLVATLNLTIHRVETLEATLVAYARVKGDGELYDRIYERERARNEALYRDQEGRPGPGPIPDGDVD